MIRKKQIEIIKIRTKINIKIKDEIEKQIFKTKYI